MSKSTLRSVSDDETAPPVESASITDSLVGSRRDVLASMRRQLAEKLDSGEIASNAIATSMGKLQELDHQIRSLDSAAEQEAQRDAQSSRARPKFTASAI